MPDVKRVRGHLLGVVAVLAVFAVIEAVSAIPFALGVLTRTPRPLVEYPFHPYLGWENHPRFTYRGRLQGSDREWAIRTDSLGESITPASQVAEPRVRIVVTGGSAVFGHGQSDNAFTIPSEIERELVRRTGVPVEVHNLAVRGYTSFQEALALERFLSNRPADLVVSISGFNDAVAAALEDGRDYGLLLHRVSAHVEMIRSMERGDLDVLPAAAQLLVGAARRGSHAVDLLGKFVDRLPRPDPPDPWAGVPPPDSAEIARRTGNVLRNYAMMDALCRQSGARYVMCLQPTALVGKRLTEAEREAVESLNPPLMARTTPVIRAFYSEFVRASKQFEFHDLTGAFDAFEGSAFGDDCHLIDAGTRPVALAVCDRVTPAVLDMAKRRAAPPGH